MLCSKDIGEKKRLTQLDNNHNFLPTRHPTSARVAIESLDQITEARCGHTDENHENFSDAARYDVEARHFGGSG